MAEFDIAEKIALNAITRKIDRVKKSIALPLPRSIRMQVRLRNAPTKESVDEGDVTRSSDFKQSML